MPVQGNPNYRSLVAGGFFSSDPFDLHVRRSIRTNNPGALNDSAWQRQFPGYVGTTQPDSAGNVTAVYVTPENGVGAWYHLLTDRYHYGATGSLVVADLAQRYAGANLPTSPEVTTYVTGWGIASHHQINGTTTIHLDVDPEVLSLAIAMFGHEIGGATPLQPGQILEGVRLKRAGTLPLS